MRCTIVCECNNIRLMVVVYTEAMGIICVYWVGGLSVDYSSFVKGVNYNIIVYVWHSISAVA